jgi:hypothetical protein
VIKLVRYDTIKNQKMSEETRVDKLLRAIKNNRIFSVIIVSGLSITAILGFWSNIKEVLPDNKNKENICQEIQTNYSTILAEIDKIESEKVTFSTVFQIRNLLQSFVSLQNKNNELQCPSVTLGLQKQSVKDKVMKITFVQIEHWKSLESQNQSTDDTKEVIKSLCEILLEFMQETKQDNEKEMKTIKNTIKLCQ